MVRLITETLKTPYAIRHAIVESLKEPELKFSYILPREHFNNLISKHFGIEPTSAEAEGIFKLFKVVTHQQGAASSNNGPPGQSSQVLQVVNCYEFFSAIILLADFGQHSEIDLIHNAELIEHKINLMLLLFDLRGKNSMNISEIVMMLQTGFSALSKVMRK